MNRRELLIACTAALALSRHARAATPTDIGAAAREAIAQAACPGVQIAVARDGRIAYSHGFGLADIERRTPVGRRSIFRIGSLSKQFTAAAAIKLASAGRLDLNAPIARWLPFMAQLPTTTALELMHHTAGFRSDEGSAPLPGAPSQVQLAQAIARETQPFDFPPGSAWHYSNANYIVLGAIIEAVMSKPLSDAYLDLLFAPLGLNRTRMDGTGEVIANRVIGYSTSENGAFAPAPAFDIAQAGGAGALRSTAEDLCRWHGALFSGRVLDDRGLQLMTAPGRLRDGRLSGANRFAPDETQYGEVQYAAGLLVSAPGDANPNFLHYGYIEGFSAMLQTFTRQRLTVAVLCNGDPGPNLPFRGIRQAVLRQG